MTSLRITSALLGATALGLAFVAPASAQTTEGDACDTLDRLIEEAGDNLGPDFADANDVAEAGDGNACLLYIGRVEDAGGITAIAPTEDGATGGQQTGERETDAEAGSPDQQADQQTGEIGTQADVQVVSPDETEQTGETRTQVDVQVVEPDQQTEEQTGETAQQGTDQQDTAQQDTTDPATTEGGASEEPATDEPASEEATADEPATEEAAADEAATEEAATDEAATDEAATDEAATDEAATDEAATDEAATDEAATADAAAEAEAGAEVVVAEITGRDVVTAEGEEIGEIERIVVVNGEHHVIFSRGGFFGIGSDDVAVPASQLELRGEELIITGIGAEEFESMPEFEAEAESELAAEDTVRIGAAE